MVVHKVVLPLVNKITWFNHTPTIHFIVLFIKGTIPINPTLKSSRKFEL